jgi:hypothetical protein
VTFAEFCERGGLPLEGFQKRIWRAIDGPEREVVVLLPRDQGKSRLVAAVAVWWLVTGAESVFCAAREEWYIADDGAGELMAVRRDGGQVGYVARGDVQVLAERNIDGDVRPLQQLADEWR